MSKNKNSNGSKKKVEKVEPIATAIDINSVQFWRAVVQQIVPDEEDKWKVGEIATALHLQAGLIKENWTSIDRISAKADGMAVSFLIKSNRSSTPPIVKVTGSYSEKHGMKAESDVADPDQTELPGMSDPPTPEAGSGENPDESNEAL